MGARNAISLADIDMFFSGYNVQRAIHSSLQTKKIGLFVGLLFVFLSTISVVPSVAADNDCNKDNNCQDDGEHWVKIKRLEDFDPLYWSGEELLTGDSDASGNKKFCTIAYTDGKKREMHDVITSIQGDQSDGEFVLRQNGNQANSIPVKFEIKTYEDSNSAPQTGGTYELGGEVRLTGNNSYDFCRENELTLSVTVSREDILKTGTTGIYFGNFEFNSRSGFGRPVEAATWPFTVTLNVKSVIQISGLEDLTLEVDNSVATDQHDFCVFAMGKEKFTLEASSDVGNAGKNGRFNLKMDGSDNYLEYKLTVSDADNNSETYYTKDTLGSFTPSNNYLCTDNFNPNMTVEITTDSVTKVPAGEYSDIMTFTVVPE